MSNRLNQKYDRRNFLKYSALVVGGAALTACNDKAPAGAPKPTSEIIPTTEVTPEGRIVDIYGTEVDVDNLEMPDLYEDRPWARPEETVWVDQEKDVRLTVEQRAASSALEITDENQVKEGMSEEELEVVNKQIALEIGHMLERIANAGRVPEERAEADELGLSWEEYIREYYMKPMVDGLFSVKYTDPLFTGTNEGLIDFFMYFVDEYEVALEDEEWRKNATVFISTDLINSKEDEYIPSERTLAIGIKILRPALTSKSDPVSHEGHLTVNVDEGTNGTYEIGLQKIKLSRQEKTNKEICGELPDDHPYLRNHCD